MAKLTDILAQLSKDVEAAGEEEKKAQGQRLADAVADPMTRPFGWQTEAPDAFFGRGQPVGKSLDLDRILALPRRTPYEELSDQEREAIVDLEMAKYSKYNENCRCKEIDPRTPCIKRLLPAQAFILREVGIAQGCLAHASVGIGKCVAPDTEIMDYSTGRRRLASEVGVLEVATFDKSLFVAPATAFPSGVKECVQVNLRDGSSLKLSTDHPVLTARGWVHAAELLATDYAAVAVEIPEPQNPTQATDDEVKFVAYMLGDGGCSQNQLSFTNADNRLIADFETAANACGFTLNEHPSRSKAREFNVCKGYARLANPGAELRERWNLHGLAKDKRTHADIWGLPRRQVALFLNRFWACDGHVSERGLEITLASEKLIDDLRFLLTRLGVRARKHYKKASYVKDEVRHEFDAWRLSLTGANALKFLAEVGDVLGKEEACQALRDKLNATTRNTNFDVVPVGWSEFAEILDELGYVPRSSDQERTRARKFLHVTQGQYVSRARFTAFCETFGYTGKYAHLATSDVAWEPVDSVTPIGVREVYDLNVPGTHNFVANGVVIHNTLLNCLAGLALTNCRKILLLIPASLRKQIQYDYLMIAEHFRVPNLRLWYGSEKPCVTLPAYDGTMPTLHVLPYSRLSLEDESDFIIQLNPDAIIADECDAARSMNSARGRRIAKWFAGGDTSEERQRRMSTKFLGWTGSLTDHSICEFNFLSLFALKDKSPLPLDPEVVEQWGQCLDATIAPSPPGELLRFCNPGEDVRHAFRRRLEATRGFVIANLTTVEGAQGQEVQIEISERQAPELPPKVAEALASVRGGVRPDYMIPGADPKAIEQLKDALEIAQCAQQVSCGVLYYWKYPRGEPTSLIKEWLARRSDYFKEVREKSMEGHTFLDSASLCEHAAMRFWGQEPKRDDRPEWHCVSWPAWLAIRDKVEPQPASYLIDDFLARDVADWARENTGIIWYTMRALAVEIHKLTGLPIHDGGVHGEKNLRKEDGSRSIIASIQSNGRGRNGLQYVFDRQLIVNPPASATGWEQLLGRLHRRNQNADVVRTWVYAHTPEVRKAIVQAMKRSEYVEGILGASQKLLRGWKEG